MENELTKAEQSAVVSNTTYRINKITESITEAKLLGIDTGYFEKVLEAEKRLENKLKLIFGL
jgi:hypothetical protein